MKMHTNGCEEAATHKAEDSATPCLDAALGTMLVNDVLPRLKAYLTTVPIVGSDDEEELVQDATLMAARMMLSASQKGRKFTAGNIAHYAAKALRSGRRSHYTGRGDAMSPGCQLDGKARFTYLDQEVEFEDGESGALQEAMPLCDYLGTGTDPAEEAARNLDWEEFLDTHPPRYRVAVCALLEGQTMREAGRRCGISDSAALNLKRKIAADLVEFREEGDALRVLQV
ncbi:hypothetical protein [Haloferula sp. A504]|uniref:hypothetical protein n=1 Tax=Haloferula sp. A504 TaxID=3373601 RepID=UPI0031C5559A|nr:hypothetical protein [Verrucomicrobiaceae bacterium E54]